MALKDFLKTKRPKEELATALAVLREYKSGETIEEWGDIPFSSWGMLEEFEEYLERLTRKR